MDFSGTHLLADLFDCGHLDDETQIEAALRAAVLAADATLLDLKVHGFGTGQGVTGVALLAESHISIHSWPENGYAALDVFMCGDAKPEACVPVLRDAFGPGRIAVSEYLRGQGA